MLYHAVGHGSQALDLALFAQQMEWLHQHCDVLSLTQLLYAPPSDRIQVAISFDDGYACIYQHVAPILLSFNFPAIVYLNSGCISQYASTRTKSDPNQGHYADEFFLIWPEVLALSQQGFEFGSHGVDHVDLTCIDAPARLKQLHVSKQTLELQLQKPCIHFAYTWGKHLPELRLAVAKMEYSYAVAAHHRPLENTDHHYALPRMNIERDYSLQDFKNIVQGRWDYLGYIHRIKHWRQWHNFYVWEKIYNKG